MSTTKALATQRAKQKITVDFYQVSSEAGGPTEFAAALRTILGTRANSRSRDIGGQPLTFYELSEAQGLFEGEIGRLRATNAPFVGTRAGRRNPVALQADEFIAECTAFLFDEAAAVLAIHTTMEGVSASRLSGFCDSVANHAVNEEFTLLPVLQRDTQQKLRRMNLFKKIDVRIATPSATPLVDADQSTRAFVRGARALGGDNLQIVIGTERGFNHQLDETAARELIRSARANEASRLLVTGLGAGDRSMTLDLIQDRLREYRVLEVRGRSSSYESRRTVVKAAFDAHTELFRNL